MDVLSAWKRTCDVNAQLHERCRIVMRFRNLALSIPAILLSMVSGITNLTNFNRIVSQGAGGHSEEVLSSVSGILSLAAATLFALHRYLTIPELQRDHMLFSNAFTRLGNEILMHMTLVESQHRAFSTTDELLKHVKHRLDLLIEQSPPLLSTVAANGDDRV